MESIEQWAGDWSDQFDQDWNEESLKEWLGKKVKISTPDGRGAVALVVGFSIDRLYIEDREVRRNSFLTDVGLQIPLFTKAQVELHEE